MRMSIMKGAKAVEETQRQKLAELFAQEHVAVIVTQGEEWPTATLQAFAETPELDLLFIMGDTAEKFQNFGRVAHDEEQVEFRSFGERLQRRGRPFLSLRHDYRYMLLSEQLCEFLPLSFLHCFCSFHDRHPHGSCFPTRPASLAVSPWH